MIIGRSSKSVKSEEEGFWIAKKIFDVFLLWTDPVENSRENLAI